MVKVVKTRFMPLAVVLLAIASLSWLSSCRDEVRAAHEPGSHYCQVDSMLQRVSEIDTLARLLDRYHEENDRVGEMLVCRYYGRELRNKSRFEDAMNIHRRGLDIAIALSDTIEMILLYNNMGTDSRRMGELSTANGFHFKAMHLSDAYSDQKSDEAVHARSKTLNGIGGMEKELWNYYAADSVFHEALAGEQQLDCLLGMAMNCENLGYVKYGIGEIDSAWHYYRKSMDYNQQLGNKVGIAYCHMGYGTLYEHARQFSHAQDQYKQAYNILHGEDDSDCWLDACLLLASVSIKLGEEDEARRYVSEAEAEMKRISSKKRLVDIYRVRYELALKENDATRALHYYVLADELLDSIYGLEKGLEMRTQRIEYQSGRKSGEMNVLNRDIDHLKHLRNLQIVTMVLLLMMAGAIIAALIYAMRTRMRTQRLMSQVEETRSLFFTNVVHQLRTPLTAIMGSIDTILSGSHESDTSPVLRENAKIIERQGHNLLMLVDRILEVGGVRSALKEPDWRSGDAVTLIHMIVESYRERCVERHIELTYISQESSVEIDTVPRYLTSIVGCLLENSINYSPEFSKITVISRVEGGHFIIRVVDSGMGISKVDLPHVFDPFYRSSAAEQLVEGVGIGLTMVRDMVMAMDGTVTVDSKKGQGSVFTVKLPCKHGSEVKRRFDKAVAPVVNISGRLKRPSDDVSPVRAADEDSPVVLVVEDHSDVARLLGLQLSQHYTVHFATDGEQGLARARECHPDLVITDVKMPVMDGYEFCRRLRQTAEIKHVPVIMLSARNQVADRVKGIQAGADAYLVKPFVSDELLAWVNRLLYSRKAMQSASSSVEALPMAGPVYGEDQVTGEEDNKRFLEQFAAAVDRDMAAGTKLNIDRIALAVKMGESQLRRRIQELTGKSLAAYVTQLRMEKAMALLQGDKNLLIGEIAERCGYADVAYFSRVFRQHYDMTPTQARNIRKS